MKSESREVDRKVLEISLDELQAPLICSTLNRTEQNREFWREYNINTHLTRRHFSLGIIRGY